ncbi:MAG: aldo/keto reductase [Gammaproteobacteria bacterium]
MQYVNLGRSGLRVSRLGLGASTFGRVGQRAYAIDFDEALPIVRRAFERGVNLFDTAEYYSLGDSEAVLGRALAELGVHREDLVIATKVGGGTVPGRENGGNLSRKHVLSAVDGSLRRLRTEYIDLYQIHRLVPGTPFEETLEALNDCVRAGKVRYLGASSMYAWQFERLLSIQERNGWARFVSMQNGYNLAYREEEREMMPLCADRGIGVIPWGALSAGLLAGNATRDGARHTRRAGTDLLKGMYPPTAQDFDIQDRVRETAARRGCSMAQVAIAWVLSKPFVHATLFGATRLAQVDDTLAALDVHLDEAEVRHLEEPYRPVAPQSI